MDTPNGNEKSGWVIQAGETEKRYRIMLLQALAQTQEEAQRTQQKIEQARRASREERVFYRQQLSSIRKRYFSPKECSPDISTKPTERLQSPQDTDGLDIAACATVIEENFAERMGIETDTRLPRVTRVLEVPLLHYIQYASNSHGLSSLIEKAVEIYTQQHQKLPLRIEVSKTAKDFLPILVDWDEGYPAPSGAIPIISNTELDVHCVQCWGN